MRRLVKKKNWKQGRGIFVKRERLEVQCSHTGDEMEVGKDYLVTVTH